MINYDRERGGVTVHIEAHPKVASLLRVRDARPEDSGNYTCAAANTESASVTVYITEGESGVVHWCYCGVGVCCNEVLLRQCSFNLFYTVFLVVHLPW